MNLHPWDLWTSDGKPRPWTPEIQSRLEEILARAPRHPGATHFYIHVVEASPEPEKAEAAADTLADLVPGAGHLVHMPAHIYARIGRWPDAAAANVRAIEADATWRAADPRPGLYGLYMAHNHHFLAFTAMMRGRRDEALTAARAVVAGIPDDFATEYAGLADGFFAIVPEVLVRFGQWEEVLAEPAPRADFLYACALWRAARATALTALGRLDEAEKERALFGEQAAAMPADRTFGNNAAADLLAIAGKVLEGEIAARRGRFDEAIIALRDAAAREDALRYDEPPDWIQPVRHALGAVLLRAGRAVEAEAAYREDLAKWRENGWSLRGLAAALEAQGKSAEAAAASARFAKAWTDADTAIETSCLCQPAR